MPGRNVNKPRNPRKGRPKSGEAKQDARIAERRILRAILTKELPHGKISFEDVARLTENSIAKPAVRNAFASLASKGLVGGDAAAIVVSTRRLRDLPQILGMRIAVEAFCLLAAVRKLEECPNSIRLLQEILQNQQSLLAEQMTDSAIVELVLLDCDFHGGIAEMGGNEAAGRLARAELIETISMRPDILRPDNCREIVREHAEIVSSLEARRFDEACGLMIEHFVSSYKRWFPPMDLPDLRYAPREHQ